METQPKQSFMQDFKLLLKNQMRVKWNQLRHQSLGALIGMVAIILAMAAGIVFLGSYAYGALTTMPPEIGRGFLSLLFMSGLVGEIFFGITAAFAALYMADDLELLFMAPVSLRAVFAVKSLSVIGSNLIVAVIFAFLPGIFYGLLFQAGALFFLLVMLVGLGLWIIGTGLSELINLLVMRIVPPHRSREAIGAIGAFTGILIALVFQIPNLLISGGEQVNIAAWLAGQEEMLRVMDFFPWGWGSLALVSGISGDFLTGFGWSFLILFLGIILFLIAFSLLERGFRRGFISLSQGGGGKRQKKHSAGDNKLKQGQVDYRSLLLAEKAANTASSWRGVWAVAKKDLLSLKRDTREWFGYLAPLIIMIFFIGQYLFRQTESTQASLIMVLIIYSLMFSGNMALQSFGREGESDWLLNSVPLAGWPVVWGKLISSVLPTMVLMEALLLGTALAIGLSAPLTLAMAVGALFLSLGASAIGLFYSINNCQYNPDSAQKRISPGASMIMYLVNMFFMFFLAFGLLYLFPPEELVAVLPEFTLETFNEDGFLGWIISVLYIISRPLLWSAPQRILLGILVTGGVWSLVFFGFIAATVRQSRKGFQVRIVTGGKKKL
ncbi:MAG: putative ABC transporter permease subunit [Bacillota bacterium]|jgi:ABC-2 type transport system permease protein